MKFRQTILVLAASATVLSPALAQSGKSPVAASVLKVKAKIGPLGDLSAFRVILQDTLAFVKGGKSKEAVTRIRAFEVLWDKQASTLSAKNSAKWTTIDGASDVALGAVRSSTSSKAESTKALAELIRLIDAG